VKVAYDMIAAARIRWMRYRGRSQLTEPIRADQPSGSAASQRGWVVQLDASV
jgi:hypothetical protein